MLALFALLAAGLTTASVAHRPRAAEARWDAGGHRVVARIAWDHMTPAARRNAVAILRRASPDMRFDRLEPDDPGSYTQPELDRELFVAASVWPDLARARGPLKRFDRPTWHYVERFWRIRNGRAVEVTSIVPEDDVEADERILTFASAIEAGEGDDATRATQLAWIIHLVGDIHQPLHCGSRVTSRVAPSGDERDGDRGGNEFWVPNRSNKLHTYWDRTITRNYPPDPEAGEDERDVAYTERVAAELMSRVPRSRFTQQQLRADDFDLVERWAEAGWHTARRQVYVGVRRGYRPSAEYNEKALGIAERATALAGYRLAALLNVVLE